MHPLYGALPVPYAPVRDIRGALVAHQCIYAPPLCRTSQQRITCFSLSQCPCGTVMPTLYSMECDFRNLRVRPKLLAPISVLYFYRLVLWGWNF